MHKNQVICDEPFLRTRDKPLVRLHPRLYVLIKDEAKLRKVQKTKVLEEAVLLGLCVMNCLKEMSNET